MGFLIFWTKPFATPLLTINQRVSWESEWFPPHHQNTPPQPHSIVSDSSTGDTVHWNMLNEFAQQRATLQTNDSEMVLW